MPELTEIERLKQHIDHLNTLLHAVKFVGDHAYVTPIHISGQTYNWFDARDLLRTR